MLLLLLDEGFGLGADETTRVANSGIAIEPADCDKSIMPGCY